MSADACGLLGTLLPFPKLSQRVASQPFLWCPLFLNQRCLGKHDHLQEPTSSSFTFLLPYALKENMSVKTLTLKVQILSQVLDFGR